MSNGTVYVSSGLAVPSGDVTYFGKDNAGVSRFRFEKSGKYIDMANSATYPYLRIHDGTNARVVIGDMGND